MKKKLTKKERLEAEIIVAEYNTILDLRFSIIPFFGESLARKRHIHLVGNKIIQGDL